MAGAGPSRCVFNEAIFPFPSPFYKSWGNGHENFNYRGICNANWLYIN